MKSNEIQVPISAHQSEFTRHPQLQRPIWSHFFKWIRAKYFDCQVPVMNNTKVDPPTILFWNGQNMFRPTTLWSAQQQSGPPTRVNLTRLALHLCHLTHTKILVGGSTAVGGPAPTRGHSPNYLLPFLDPFSLSTGEGALELFFFFFFKMESHRTWWVLNGSAVFVQFKRNYF